MPSRAELLVEFGIDCGRAGIGYGTALDLRKAAIKLHRLDEQNCNGEIAEDDYLYKVGLVIAPLVFPKNGFYYEHQSDPRGWPIIIKWTDSDGIVREFRVPPF